LRDARSMVPRPSRNVDLDGIAYRLISLILANTNPLSMTQLKAGGGVTESSDGAVVECAAQSGKLWSPCTLGDLRAVLGKF
jgi:hypothetical protein